MTFTVYVEDNGHYRDESARRELAAFETYAEALAMAKDVVERSLREGLATQDSASALYAVYCAYGEDPFIIPDGSAVGEPFFSARAWARTRCAELIPSSAGDPAGDE